MGLVFMYALLVWAALPGLFSSLGDPAKMRTELEEGSGPLVDDCVLLRGSSSCTAILFFFWGPSSCNVLLFGASLAVVWPQRG